MRQRGFTLLEAVIVVAILAAIASLSVVLLSESEDKALGDVARSEMVALRDASLRWKIDIGALPSTLGDLRRGTAPPGVATWNPETKRGWRGPYILSGRDAGSNELGDPWYTAGASHHYSYSVSAGVATIRCDGPDGESGTSDDLAESFP